MAGFTAYQVSQWFHVHYLRPSVPVAVGSGELAFLKALMLGALLGLVALALIEALEAAERFFHRLSLPAPVRPVVGGVVLVALALVAGTEYLGMGSETIEQALAGAALPPAAFLWKLVFTAVTLGSGWSGGVMFPIFFIGATAGSWAAPLLGLDRAAGAAMGLSALLAGATNAPIASSVIAVEMFGPEVGVYAAAACFSGVRCVRWRTRFSLRLDCCAGSPSGAGTLAISESRTSGPEGAGGMRPMAAPCDGWRGTHFDGCGTRSLAIKPSGSWST